MLQCCLHRQEDDKLIRILLEHSKSIELISDLILPHNAGLSLDYILVKLSPYKNVQVQYCHHKCLSLCELGDFLSDS